MPDYTSQLVRLQNHGPHLYLFSFLVYILKCGSIFKKNICNSYAFFLILVFMWSFQISLFPAPLFTLFLNWTIGTSPVDLLYNLLAPKPQAASLGHGI